MKPISVKLRKFINEKKKLPLSDKDVVDLVDKKAKVVLYENLHKYDNLNQVFGKFDAIFLMYPTSSLNYGHWVAVLKRNGGKQIEVFDPLGTKGIDDQLNWTSPQVRSVIGNVPQLTRVLLTTPDSVEIINNKVPFQKDNTNVSSCGRHTALRILMRKYPLDEFTEYFKTKAGKGPDADDIATILTMLKIESKE